MLGVGSGADGLKGGFAANGLLIGGDKSGVPTGGEAGFFIGLGPSSSGSGFPFSEGAGRELSGLAGFSFAANAGSIAETSTLLIGRIGNCGFSVELLVEAASLGLLPTIGPGVEGEAGFSSSGLLKSRVFLAGLLGVSDVFSGDVLRTSSVPCEGGR